MTNAYCSICSQNKEIDLNPGDVMCEMRCGHYYNLVTGNCYGESFDILSEVSELKKTVWYLINVNRKNRDDLLNVINKMDNGPVISILTH